MVNVVEDWLAYGMLKAREGQWELTVALEELGTGAPQNLRQMIEQQVARLTPAVQRMVEAASVAGEEFSAATVAAGTEEAVVGVEEQCEELVLRDYLLQARGTEEWPDGTVATRYGFVHALYREVAYEKIPAARRAQCHQRIGERLEAGYGTSTGEVAAQLALHFERARDYPRAIRYLQQAAENAARRSAHREGIAHLTKALVLLKTFPDEPGRTRQELSLLTALSVSLMVTRGYADSEVGKVFAQARKLCQEIGEAPQLFPVLWGLCAFYAVRAESRAAWETAGGLLRLAQSVHDPTLLIMANVARGGTSLWIGKFSAAREHLEQGIALYNAQHDRSPLAPGGYDPGIACFSYGALALWGIGYPDQALKRVHEALLLAEELGHPYTLAHTQAWAAALYQHYGEEQKAQAQAESVITLSAKWDFPLWLAMGIVLRGWALVEHGELEQGLAQIRQGIDAYRATGAGWGQSYYPALLAEAYGKAQQSEEGLKVLAETLPPQCHPEEHWWEAEKYRLKGELTLQSKASLGQVQGKSKTSQNKPKVPNPQAEAEECFQKAIDIARRQGAKSLELRAVMSLSRLWLKQGKKKHPQQMLAKVYNWFTEGFDTKDLQEAKALLTQLT
jgi:predicted ATPase